MATTIPEIAVTQEDSHDEEYNYISLAEALTDIEDLDEDKNIGQLSLRTKKSKSKLKIKLNSNNDALTDMEDFEASDDEDDKFKIIVPHSKPISLDDLDLEAGIVEESYKTQIKTAKGKKKLKTQCSTSQVNVNELNYKVFDNYTDEEIFDTDNEIITNIVPENDFDLDNDATGNSNISDKSDKTGLLVPQLNTYLSDSNESDNSISSNQFLNAVSPSSNLSDLTDVEILEQNADVVKPTKKNKLRRRRYRGRRQSVTDVEELDVSDDETLQNVFSKPKMKIVSQKHLIRSHSLQYDSDNEDNRLPFPLCKKIAKKNQSILNIPEFDTNFPTDVEDFDEVSENILSSAENSKEGDEAFEKKLNEMATYYSNTKEAHSAIKSNICRTQSIKTDDTLIDHNNTDSDHYQSDTNDKDDIESIKCDIKFTSSKIHATTKNPSNLLVPIQNEDPITDCENVDSSDEEYSNTLPLAVANYLEPPTEEEEFEEELDESSNDLELSLPPPVRNLIILKENESLPTVQILPLLEESPLGSPHDQSFNANTDEEIVSEAEEATEDITVVSMSDLNLPDCGVINEANVQKISGGLRIPSNECDDLTDTEEIVLSHRRRKPPKFKHMHERFLAEKNKLAVRNELTGLTDTEDLIIGDNHSEDSFRSLSPLINQQNFDGLTDDEVLYGASDDEKDVSNNRALSCTPRHMREMGGETVINKEGSGTFSINDRLLINKPIKILSNVAVTPIPTDTEDLAASADEDFNYCRPNTATPNQINTDLYENSSSSIISENKTNVDSENCMYLKGGGFFEYFTDLEFISKGDSYINRVLKPDLPCYNRKVLLTFRDGSAYLNGSQEWETSNKPLRLEPTASKLDRDAAQKGAEPSASSTSIKDATTSSTRPEGEEGVEKEETGYERNVADQHQLSEEMKELLKELEKESKQ